MVYPSDRQVQKIQAAVLRQRGGPLKIESLEMEGPQDDEVLVRIVATGICHTDVQSLISRITGGGVDYVLEISGIPKMLKLAASVLNPQGTVALFNGESGPDFRSYGQKAVSIIQGDAVPQQFIPKLILLYKTGKFPFDRLVKFYEFGKINQAIAAAKRGDAVKPVLQVSAG